MWQIEDLYTIWSLYLKTLKEVSLLAQEEKELFLELVEPYQDTQYLSLITFLIFGYSKNPSEYKNGIFKLLTNKKLLGDIDISYDNGYELALLLHKSFKLFEKKEQEQIFKGHDNFSGSFLKISNNIL